MTGPAGPPRRKDPTRRTRLPVTPPGNRSREAHGLAAMAAAGRFALQCCRRCGHVHYPPRQLCERCLDGELEWRDVADGGRVLAETTVRHANDLYFRERLPWKLGLVGSDAGPSIVAHLAEGCERGRRVRLALHLDRAGNAVVAASPERDASRDDPRLREMVFDPRGRRVLVVDGTTGLGRHLVEAFLASGAREVFAGFSRPWNRSPDLAALRGRERVSVYPLDVTDTDAVEKLAALIGDKVEILVNNSSHVRMGGALDRLDFNITRQEMEIHYHGLLRLAGYFGPVMRARGADGPYGAVAWVNMFSAWSLVNNPELGTYSASQAAALSLSHCMRAELAAGGVRVVNVFAGPLDDEWHQLVPPPKLDPATVATRVVRGLERGLEDIAVGAVAEEIARRLAENPKEIERSIRL